MSKSGHFTQSNLFLIYAVAVIVRLLFIGLYPGVNYYNGISNEYINVASNLVHGHGLTMFVDIARYNSGLTHFAYEPFISRPIGYVLFTALPILLVGVVPAAIQILQALVTGFGAVLVYRLSREIFANRAWNERVATFAGLLAACWPNQARFEIALLPDGLTTLIMLGLTVSLVRYLKYHHRRDLLIAAGVLAISIFFRPDLVLFPAFFFVAVGLRRSFAVSFRATIVLVIGLALAIGLNTWKNYAISGVPLALNLGSGTTMFEGISQFGDTLGTTYADERLAHNYFNSKDLFYPDGVENDRRVWHTAIDTIAHHPWFYATVVARRVPLMFTVRGLYYIDTGSRADPGKDLAKQGTAGIEKKLTSDPVRAGVTALSALAGWALVVLGFLGIWLTRRRHEGLVFVPTLVLFYFVSTHLLTNVEPRYFYPCVPLLMPFAAYAVVRRRPTAR
jgi:4-amino-4-deoxy-L-arabinose transferase-like glycosyltransferase